MRAIFENFHDAIGVHVDGIWVFANPAIPALFGVDSAAKLIGKSLLEVVAPSERPRIRDYVARRTKNLEAPTRYLTKGLRHGTEFDLEVALSSFLQDGQRHVIVSLHDVTERLHNDSRLQESEELYRLLVTTSPEAIILHREGSILYVNPAAVRLFGAVCPEDLVGTAALDRVHPECRAAALKRIEDARQGIKPSQLYEEKMLRLDGSPLSVEVSGGLIILDGKPTVQIVVHELTERLQAQEERNSLLTRYQTLLRTSSDGIHILDARGGLIEANPTFLNMLGYSAEEASGLTVTDWDKNWTTEELPAIIAELIRRPALFETQYRGKDGTFRDVEISTSPVLLDGNQYLYASARDITERKRTDAALQRNQKLESLGVLAGGIAHDFNNILAGLSGQTEVARMLLKAGNVEAALARLDKAPAVFERGRALSRRLLTFSKGGTPIRATVKLGSRILEWVDFALLGSHVLPSLEIDPELWVCECDADQIGQVVNNLLINARQASPPGGTITIRASNVWKPQPYVAIEVTDGGPGIPPQTLPRIFDPFFTTKPEGTGLGLSVSLSIAQQHQGWIDVSAPPQGGTTFTLNLPASPEKRQALRTGPFVPLRCSGPVLVMDDEDNIRETVAAMLVSFGFDAFQARNGDEVLTKDTQLHESNRPVVLYLMDNIIPGGMGGLETTQRLKDRGASGRIILMSGYFEASTTTGVVGGHGLVHLAKPFSSEELALVIASMNL